MRLPLSRWTFLAAFVLLCGFLGREAIAFHDRAEASQRLVLTLSHATELIATLEATEMELLYGPADHRAAARNEFEQARNEYAAGVEQLPAFGGMKLDVMQAYEACRGYDAAVRQQLAFVLAGDMVRPHRHDADVVDPAAAHLSAQLIELRHEAEFLTQSSNRRANLTLTALALIGASAVALLVYLDSRRRTLDTERKALAYSETRFRLLTERASDVVLIVDPNSIVRYASPSIEVVLGMSPDRACGRSLLELVLPDDRPVVSEHLRAAQQGKSSRVEFRGLLRESEWVYLEANIRDLSSAREIGGLVVNLHDIDDQKRAQTQLLHTALHDTLTGLPNRTLFTERLQAAIDHLDREDGRDGNRTVAVLFVDIDDFKVINDSVGHHVGDLLIMEVAQRMVACLRRSDTVGRLHSSKGIVARLGGDEFTVMLDDIHDGGDAVRVCERIQTAMRQPFLLGGGQFYASVSIGVAVSAPQLSAEDLMRNADVAMYRAKARGKARYAIFDAQMHERVTARLRLETDLRLALEKNEFILHYQPIACLKTGRIRRVEALLRWKHNGTLRLPGEFIPAAEESGLIRPIGEWALREACRQAAIWNRSSAEPVIVCVNISGRQFTHPTFLEEVMSAIADAGVAPAMLEFEITEGVAMDDAEKTRYTLGQLRALGVQLALDDFGTGYSSLSYLRLFAVNTLKIDRSFISDLPTNRENVAIVQTIIELARVLGLETVAEGIESAEQLAMLQRFGCGLGQGYLLEHPEPPNAPPWPSGLKLLSATSATQTLPPTVLTTFSPVAEC